VIGTELLVKAHGPERVEATARVRWQDDVVLGGEPARPALGGDDRVDLGLQLGVADAGGAQVPLVG
jgi:hypothetical protein